MNLIREIFLHLSSMSRVFGSSIMRKVRLSKLMVEWRRININNDTVPVKYFPIGLVTIGDYSYGPIDIYTYYAKGEGLEVGRYCSIAKDVKFILGGNHRMDYLMTFPVRNKFINRDFNESFSKGKIILKDDVWIGVGATILSGVELGQGCVVAAGAVVTKSFPPYSVIGGNPARIIRMRFSENIIQILLNDNIRLGEFRPEFITKNIDLFYDVLTKNNLELIIPKLNEFRSI
jgi:acetyltransferase-like isoleucine patch superfamily enzyme